MQDVREAVNADSGVSAYIQRYREVFTDYPAYQRKLELLQNIKKSLLDKMFV